MKKISIIAASLLLAVGAFAQAPVYAAQSVGVPSLVTVTTNLVTPLTIDVRRQKEVTFQVTLSATGVQTNAYTLCPSVDGISYDSTVPFTVYATTTGAAKTTVTNLTVNGRGFLILTAITPTGVSITATNSVKYGIKTGAP